MYSCSICGDSYNDELLYSIHYEIMHNTKPEQLMDEDLDISSLPYAETESRPVRQMQPIPRDSVIRHQPASSLEKSRPSVIRYAPPQQNHLHVRVLAEALPGSIVRHFVIDNNVELDLNLFLSKCKPLLLDTLNKELHRLNFIKFGIVLDSTFTNIANETSQRGFITKNKSIFATSDLDALLDECLEDLLHKIEEHQGRGSGWTLLSANSIDLRVHKHGFGDRGSSYIPLPKKISHTHSCINVRNEDNECFRYAMTSKFLRDEANNDRPSRRYNLLANSYNFAGVVYPVSLNDIRRFERNNPGVSVNVFGLDDRHNVYPLKIVPAELRDHTDLLLLKNNTICHYVYIKNFNALVARQMTKFKSGITVCKRCFCFTSKCANRGGSLWLIEHLRLCNKQTPVSIRLPTRGNDTISFNKTSQQYPIPIVVYADFETSLIPLEVSETNTASRQKYQKHEPNSYCLLLKSNLSEDHLEYYGLTSRPKVYRGENAASKFVDDLYVIARKVHTLYNYIVPMEDLDENQEEQHNSASRCYLCENPFTDVNGKVRDHDHLTGYYRGAACNSCNINYKLPNFIPIILHNLSGFDAHFIIPQLGRDTGSIDVLATTTERFISFSKKVGRMKLRFVDSFRFMPSSLSKLSSNLQRQDLVETKKLVAENQLDLVLRKGVFPYDYIDSLAKFEETSLPPATRFYNKLCDSEISEEDYQHACRVWDELGFTTLGHYSDFYVTLDVTLLCDVMEEFRNTCMVAYGLDPLHSYTSPGLAWQAMLKETKCTIDLLTDIDMILMIESGVRGGLTQCVTRYVKANNQHLPNFDESQESVYLGYFDANNLYGWAMSMPLPSGGFEWVDPNSLGDILEISKEGEVGYILECDFEYLDSLHEHHYDLPLLAKNEVPPNGKHQKLMLTLENKSRYVAHYWVVQQAIQLGLCLTKIHRVIKFSQSCWLKPYIDSNTARRAASTTSFQKDFFKLMNNSIFGKTLENKRKHKNVKLVTDPKKLQKLVQKPTFKTSIIINENLVVVCMEKSVVKMDRPLYVGMSILDISKTHMYDFHYNKMLTFFGRDRIGIAYMDTDAFTYWIKTLNMYEDLKMFPYSNDFDFSDYPTSHPTYDNGVNKKVLGKFKDEANGVPLVEFVGLMCKMYALKLHVEPTHFPNTNEEGVIKKAKGVKQLYLKKKIMFEHYYKCLFENMTYTATFNSIRSFNHQLFSITETKKSLSSHDDKRKILEDGIHTLPFGHYSLRTIED